MKKFFKAFRLSSFFICMLILGLALWGEKTLPDSYSTVDGRLPLRDFFTARAAPDAAAAFSAEGCDKSESIAYEVKLWSVIPVKTVNVRIQQRRYLAAGGELVGVRLKTEGLLVVGTEPFAAADGGTADPAAAAGIRKGDTLLELNGTRIETNDALTSAIENSGGSPLSVTLQRDGKTQTVTLTPQKTAATGLYKGGLWVRDSTVGIGTLTYCDIENGCIAALGHGIYDADTEKLMRVSSGEICTATVSSVKKGAAGVPGEITGTLGPNTLGSITANSEEGVFGELYYMEGEPELYPVATASEVHTGGAQVICTVTDGQKQSYEIEITRISGGGGEKDMTLKITDQALLAVTGGIVQGMSGSPILQDGMLVGAVTHVFVNDPKCGYGIFAETMLEQYETN